MSVRRPLTLLLALAAGLTGSTATADDLTATWVGRFDLGDAPISVTVDVAPAAEGALEARLTDAQGVEQPLTLEAWAVEGNAVSFRLLGFDRPYRFSGRVEGGAIRGDLERQPPSVPLTDLYLLEIDAGPGSWRIGAMVPMTDREGYDNQPYFLPAGDAVLYTSIRDGQADIFRYDLADGAARQLTATSESEYSPTPLPDGSGFSTVRVEADGTQRLWAFDLDGTKPRLLLEAVAPVGYHAWLDAETLALFVLGDPATLQITDLPSGTAVVRDWDIGRSLHRSPPGGAVSYIRKGGPDGWTIGELDLPDGAIRDLVPTPSGREDFVWTPAGDLLMGHGSKLLVSAPDASGWQEVADLSGQSIQDITRLAMSPDGRRLVVVGTRPDTSQLPARVTLELVRRP